MKVGFVSSHAFVNPGGVKNHILELSKQFEKKGIETKIIVPRRNNKENYGEKVIFLGHSIPLKISGNGGDILYNLNPRKITEILDQEKFDVLHFHNFIVPPALQILNRSKAVNVITGHSNFEIIPLLKTLKPALDLILESNASKINGIIGVSEIALEPYQNYPGPKRIIPNGIDVNKFNPNNEKISKFVDDKLNILFLGRFEERKGLMHILRAYNLLKKDYGFIRLIVVGDGAQKQQALNYIAENKLEDVFFEGTKTGDEVPKYYATSDIYVSPAPFGESFGIVLLEAMATGKPVVGYANLGYKEVLKGSKGEKFFAEPGNVNDLKEKLEILIKDRDLRKEMGEWGLEYSKRYSWENVSSEVLDFYKSVS